MVKKMLVMMTIKYEHNENCSESALLIVD